LNQDRSNDHKPTVGSSINIHNDYIRYF